MTEVEMPVMPSDHSEHSFFISNSSPPTSPEPSKRLGKGSDHSRSDSRASQKSQNSRNGRNSRNSQHSQRKHLSSGSQSDSLAPPPQSPYPPFTDPSPVDSNGTASTETTEIEDDGAVADDESKELESDIEWGSPNKSSASPLSPESMLGRIDTSLAARTRSDSDQPQSVIHAPQNFRPFSKPSSPKDKRSSPPTDQRRGTPSSRGVSQSPTESTSRTIVSPRSPDPPRSPAPPQDDPRYSRPASRSSPHLSTDVPKVSEKTLATPQAHTREQLEEEWSTKRRQTKSLAGIPEGGNGVGEAFEGRPEVFPDIGNGRSSAGPRVPEERHDEIDMMKDCLENSWATCVSYSGLSSNHRNRVINYRGKSEIQNEAWRSCWKLCQHLYEIREDEPTRSVDLTLDLFRNFCNALFDARCVEDETIDGPLRTCFQLNNHLFDVAYREIRPDVQEKTLEFYMLLCYRMMKRETSLPLETDKLLRACWDMIRVLFTMQESYAKGEDNEEENLRDALVSCDVLMGQFKEGWYIQNAKDRTTPKATQTGFPPSQIQPKGYYTYNDRATSVSRSSTRSSSHSMSHSSIASSQRFNYANNAALQPPPPETPTTVFDDTGDHIEMVDDNAPNIFVLGPENPRAASVNSRHRHHDPNHWSSADSVNSETSYRTSSTATVGNKGTHHVPRLRLFLVWLAKNKGFELPHKSSTARSQALQAWAKTLTPDRFYGESPQQAASLVEQYKSGLLRFPSLAKKYGQNPTLCVEVEVRTSVADLGRSITWLAGKYAEFRWTEDVFRLAFGAPPKEGMRDTGSTIEG